MEIVRLSLQVAAGPHLQLQLVDAATVASSCTSPAGSRGTPACREGGVGTSALCSRGTASPPHYLKTPLYGFHLLVSYERIPDPDPLGTHGQVS